MFGNVSANRCIGRIGFTLLELLVTFAIIGILIAILIPAMQSAREAGRRTQCQNNLKNIGTALVAFESSNGTFPFGGWGYEWVGIPGRGFGKSQPGGWVYCILPYVEEQPLHDLGDGADGAEAHAAYSQRLLTPVPLFVCPSRRPCLAWPISNRFPNARTPKPFGLIEQVARSDYAINGGTSDVFAFPGPSTLTQGNDEQFWRSHSQATGFSGISHLRIACSTASIVDGMSHTYLIGEKHLNIADYATGESLGDKVSMYSGYSNDLYRFGGDVKRLQYKLSPFVPPLYDNAQPPDGLSDHICFGSAHPGGLNMTFCDGSVRIVDYGVDQEIHFRSAHRRDRGDAIDKLK